MNIFVLQLDIAHTLKMYNPFVNNFAFNNQSSEFEYNIDND